MSRQKTVRYWVWVERLVQVLVLLLVGLAAQTVVVPDNDPYTNLVLAVDPDIQDCIAILQSTKSVLSEASNALLEATAGHLAFTKVTFLVPNLIAGDCNLQLDNTEAAAKYPRVHMSVGGNHPIFGGEPWTLQPQRCGHAGRGLYLPHNFIRNNSVSMTTKGKQVVHEWAKYRWGVFEEYGLAGDPVFPLAYTICTLGQDNSFSWSPNFCSNSPINGSFREPCDMPDCEFNFEEGQTATSSLLALPTLSSISLFCDNTTHHALTPTKQNAQCAGRSLYEVLDSHQDFQGPARNSSRGEMEVEYVTYDPMTAGNYVLLVDTSKPMTNNQMTDRWDMLRSAVKQWVLEDVADGSTLGVVTFTTGCVVQQAMTVVDSETRLNISDALPTSPSSTSASKSITLALSYIQQYMTNKGVVILITFPMYVYELAEDIVNAAGNNTVWPVLYSFSSAVSQSYIEKFQTLANETGGRALVVKDDTYTNDRDTKQSLKVQVFLVHHLRSIMTASLPPAAPAFQLQVSHVELDCDLCTMDVFLGDNVNVSLSLTVLLYSQRQPVSLSVNGSSPTLPPSLLAGTAYRIDLNFQNGHNRMQIRFSEKFEPHLVEILAEEMENDLSIEFWASHDLSFLHLDIPQDPVSIHVKVSNGGRAVVGAMVEVEGRVASNSFLLPLSDTGGGPDVTGNDGVYSGYWGVTPQGPTTYTLAVRVTPTSTAVIVGHFPARPDSGVRCCGSTLRVDLLPSQAFSTNVYFIVGAAEVLSAGDLGFPPARITDLRGTPLGDHVSLTFTAPGNELDRGYAQKYHVYWSEDGSEWFMAQKVSYSLVEGGSLAQVELQPSICDQQLLYVVRAQNWQIQEGSDSNIASVAVSCDAKPIVLPQEECTSMASIICGAFFGGMAVGLLVTGLAYFVHHRYHGSMFKKDIRDNIQLSERNMEETFSGAHSNPALSYEQPRSRFHNLNVIPSIFRKKHEPGKTQAENFDDPQLSPTQQAPPPLHQPQQPPPPPPHGQSPPPPQQPPPPPQQPAFYRLPPMMNKDDQPPTSQLAQDGSSSHSSHDENNADAIYEDASGNDASSLTMDTIYDTAYV